MIKYEVIVDKNVTKWYLNGNLHREDGPAIEHLDGSKQWWINGNLHREDGPAIEWNNGTKGWWINGKQHREDGPAAEYADGTKQWWLNGNMISKEEFDSRIKSTCNDKIVEIDGVKYKLVKI